MQLQPTALGHRRKALDTIDLQIRLAVARDLHEPQQFRLARHGVALKEGLALDAVRRAHNGAWPSLEMADDPSADRFEVAREIELRYCVAVAAVGPQRLVGF